MPAAEGGEPMTAIDWLIAVAGVALVIIAIVLILVIWAAPVTGQPVF